MDALSKKIRDIISFLILGDSELAKKCRSGIKALKDLELVKEAMCIYHVIKFKKSGNGLLHKKHRLLIRNYTLVHNFCPPPLKFQPENDVVGIHAI